MKLKSPLTENDAKELKDLLRRAAEAPPMSDEQKRKSAIEQEKNGCKLLHEEKKPQEAFDAFDRAARYFKETGDHQRAAACFASAGSCWLIQRGQELLWNASSRYEYGGDEATKYHNNNYAKYLYEKSAALARAENSLPAFSRAFYKSKLSENKHAFLIFTNSEKLKKIPGISYATGCRIRCKHFFLWLMNSFLFLVWGYGERPFRTFCSALFIMFLSTLTYYYSGQLMSNGQIFNPSVYDSVYLSVVTFTTLGYGDIVPVGVCRVASMIEALSGLFLAPLFLVALVRKYVGTFS